MNLSVSGALETNPESNAYVKEFKDFPVYFQGCLGGKVPEVIDMVKNLIEERKNLSKILLLSGMMKVI